MIIYYKNCGFRTCNFYWHLSKFTFHTNTRVRAHNYSDTAKSTHTQLRETIGLK